MQCCSRRGCKSNPSHCIATVLPGPGQSSMSRINSLKCLGKFCLSSHPPHPHPPPPSLPEFIPVTHSFPCISISVLTGFLLPNLAISCRVCPRQFVPIKYGTDSRGGLELSLQTLLSGASANRAATCGAPVACFSGAALAAVWAAAPRDVLLEGAAASPLGCSRDLSYLRCFLAPGDRCKHQLLSHLGNQIYEKIQAGRSEERSR